MSGKAALHAGKGERGGGRGGGGALGEGLVVQRVVLRGIGDDKDGGDRHVQVLARGEEGGGLHVGGVAIGGRVAGGRVEDVEARDPSRLRLGAEGREEALAQCLVGEGRRARA